VLEVERNKNWSSRPVLSKKSKIPALKISSKDRYNPQISWDIKTFFGKAGLPH
jgi:hypothetical protein